MYGKGERWPKVTLAARLLRTSSQRRVKSPAFTNARTTHPASFIDTKASHRAICSTHLPSHSQTRHSSSVRTQSYNTESGDGSIRRLTINRTDTYTYLFRRVISHCSHRATSPLIHDEQCRAVDVCEAGRVVLTLLAWTRVHCCPGSRLCGSGRNQTLARRPARRPNERGPYRRRFW